MVEDFPLAIYRIKEVYCRKRAIIITGPYKFNISEMNEMRVEVRLFTC